MADAHSPSPTRTAAVGRTGLPRHEVPTHFDDGAADYDRLVGLNPGYHDHLHASAARMRLPRDGAGLRLLDAGCGTGASTAALLGVAPRAEIVAVDASAGMLERARTKPWPASVRFVHTDVEAMAAHGVTGPFDGILAAYLLRNLDDPDAQLRRFHDLLRPGGTLAVHEYSVADSARARAVWHAVCWGVIVPLGRATSGGTALYRHLWRSVTTFDGVGRLRDRMRAAGFDAVGSETMTGWQRDVVHTVLGTRP
ncbi:class I SAM-dependent methyltransferase [Pseudonocardia sp. C8]|uniref:class I SAM-dependent methyltransferase n=1 Tax=Pseudonocardia sp. C8 TaxID=2762759 RepID=UPI001642F2F2|nr:class I SAM-dependent methyltransferase [Pseudonocardia sp. C8]MBC3192411.1 class I SAM-dependent methyltransferase [Pseudonocardia sp. C8]